ncbi:hypothetical protein GDO78_019233 [Eleutherodactylus coqui]|uniref:Uncharacterized protein n=1 Tax=Eleutherodactylus coqui TaxID=57060 RepID=A0A8J6C2B2_ELECQ|nr:hypothetical protein GDO78_019233 [Eleutherodactylus coqui]
MWLEEIAKSFFSYILPCPNFLGIAIGSCTVILLHLISMSLPEPLCLPQVVVLCFAVIFGSFTQTFDPYPSATKTLPEPSVHSVPESYAASIVRSRSILSFEEHHAWEELYSSAVTVDSPDSWERSKEIISQHHTAILEEFRLSQEKPNVLFNDSSRDPEVRHR